MIGRPLGPVSEPLEENQAGWGACSVLGPLGGERGVVAMDRAVTKTLFLLLDLHG